MVRQSVSLPLAPEEQCRFFDGAMSVHAYDVSILKFYFLS